MLCHDNAPCPAGKILDCAGMINIVVGDEQKVNILGANSHSFKLLDGGLPLFDVRSVEIAQVFGHKLLAVR